MPGAALLLGSCPRKKSASLSAIGPRSVSLESRGTLGTSLCGGRKVRWSYALGSTAGSTTCLHRKHHVIIERAPSSSAHAGKKQACTRHLGQKALVAEAAEARLYSHELSLSPTLDTTCPLPPRSWITKSVPVSSTRMLCHFAGCIPDIVIRSSSRRMGAA